MLRILTLIDEQTHESLAIHVDWHIKATDVIQIIEKAMKEHGNPEHIRNDNGLGYKIPEEFAQDCNLTSPSPYGLCFVRLRQQHQPKALTILLICATFGFRAKR